MKNSFFKLFLFSTVIVFQLLSENAFSYSQKRLIAGKVADDHIFSCQKIKQVSLTSSSDIVSYRFGLLYSKTLTKKEDKNQFSNMPTFSRAAVEVKGDGVTYNMDLALLVKVKTMENGNKTQWRPVRYYQPTAESLEGSQYKTIKCKAPSEMYVYEFNNRRYPSATVFFSGKDISNKNVKKFITNIIANQKTEPPFLHENYTDKVLWVGNELSREELEVCLDEVQEKIPTYSNIMSCISSRAEYDETVLDQSITDKSIELTEISAGGYTLYKKESASFSISFPEDVYRSLQNNIDSILKDNNYQCDPSGLMFDCKSEEKNISLNIGTSFKKIPLIKGDNHLNKDNFIPNIVEIDVVQGVKKSVNVANKKIGDPVEDVCYSTVMLDFTSVYTGRLICPERQSISLRLGKHLLPYDDLLQSIHSQNPSLSCQLDNNDIKCHYKKESQEKITVNLQLDGFEPSKYTSDSDFNLIFKDNHFDLLPIQRKVSFGRKKVGDAIALCGGELYVLKRDDASLKGTNKTCQGTNIFLDKYFSRTLKKEMLEVISKKDNQYCKLDNSHDKIFCERPYFSDDGRLEIDFPGYEKIISNADFSLIDKLVPIFPEQKLDDTISNLLDGMSYSKDYELYKKNTPPTFSSKNPGSLDQFDKKVTQIRFLPDSARVIVKNTDLGKEVVFDFLLGSADSNSEISKVTELLSKEDFVYLVGKDNKKEKLNDVLNSSSYVIQGFKDELCEKSADFIMNDNGQLSYNHAIKRYYAITKFNKKVSECRPIIPNNGVLELSVLPFFREYDAWNMLVLAIPREWHMVGVIDQLVNLFDLPDIKNLEEPLVLVLIDDEGNSYRITSSDRDNIAAIKNMSGIFGYEKGRGADDIFLARQVSDVDDSKIQKMIIVAGGAQSASPSRLNVLRHKVFVISDDCDLWLGVGGMNNCKPLVGKNNAESMVAIIKELLLPNK